MDTPAGSHSMSSQRPFFGTYEAFPIDPSTPPGPDPFAPQPNLAEQALAQADKVTLPSHYARHHIEPIRFVVENFGPGFLIGNIVKYILRYDAKDGHKDLAKAARYVEMLRHFEAGDPDWYQPPHDFMLPAEVDAPLHSKAMKVSRG